MEFNTQTLFSLPFGLLVPIVVILFFLFSKRRQNIAYDAVAYGFVSFLGSIVAVFIVFIIANALFLSSVTFENENSGLGFAGTVISVMIAILYFVCETFKIMTVKKFRKDENKYLYSGIAFSAGVIIAQNAIVFVALNIFDGYEMEIQYALFSGAILCVTGIMYSVLSAASDIALKDASESVVYGINAVYYLFWIFAIIFSGSTVLMYISVVFFFVLSFVIGGVFLFHNKKTKSAGENL